MLRIRLTRVGRKHDPTYRLIVVDSRKAPQSGAYLENLGFYNPRKVGSGGKPLMSDFQTKADRIKYWISQGAQLSGTAHNLLVSAKVIEGKKVNVFKASKKKEKTEAPILTPTESEDQNRESAISQPNQDDSGEIGKELDKK